jgi:CDP-diacylglycerol--glycerol-3-phosphate 3-phosphatidyltransferase
MNPSRIELASPFASVNRVDWAKMRKAIPNALSVIRLPAALAFLIFYEPSNKILYCIAVSIAIFAVCTDILDGYLARKWKVTSDLGYFLDALGDKSFHLAVLVVMLHSGALSLTMAWAFILRDILIYAARGLDRRMWDNVKRLRPLSRAAVVSIRLYFLGFVVSDGLTFLPVRAPHAIEYYQLFGYIALALSYSSLILTVLPVLRTKTWADDHLCRMRNHSGKSIAESLERSPSQFSL